GRFSKPASSSIECAPTTSVPFASLAIKSSTFETVRLNTATLNPRSFMLRTRFCPITARPIRPISHDASGILFSKRQNSITTDLRIFLYPFYPSGLTSKSAVVRHSASIPVHLGNSVQSHSGELAHCHNSNLAAAPQNVDAYRVCIAFACQVDAGVSDLEVVNANRLQLLRQCRVMKIDLRLPGTNLQSQTGLQQHEDRSRGPGLGRASNRVKRRAFPGTATEAADQFGKTMEHHLRRKVEQAGGDPQCQLLVASSLCAESDQSVVVRPHRPVVIRHGVISALAAGQGAHAPAREERRR